MKAKMTYLAMLMMAMFAISACNNEDEFSDIMNSNNLLTENIEIFEVERENTTVACPDKERHTASLFYCYENKSEMNGLYMIDNEDLLNWDNRTLVMVHAFYHSHLGSFTIKVYEKNGKYVIEVTEKEHSGFRNAALDNKCFGILLDKANIEAKDILLKVGIYHPAGTDSEGNEHKEYYEFI